MSPTISLQYRAHSLLLGRLQRSIETVWTIRRSHAVPIGQSLKCGRESGGVARIYLAIESLRACKTQIMYVRALRADKYDGPPRRQTRINF